MFNSCSSGLCHSQSTKMELEEVPFKILQEITNDFSEERKLGEGSFGDVYRAVTKNGEDIAVKKLKEILFRNDPDQLRNDQEQFRNEFYSLRMLKHINIVQVLGYCYETKQIPMELNGIKVLAEETHRALCLEYLHSGSLKKHLSDESCGLEWHARYRIIKGICEGLKYIHEDLEKPLLHLDLKPDNVLLDKDMVPKIADFGLSRIFGQEPTRTTRNPYGTLGYQPPEYIEKGEISKMFDIFSLGVIMIDIVSGPEGRSKYEDMKHEDNDKFIDLVKTKWRNRLQATERDSSLEAYCHQVEICTQIALDCVEQESQKRPNIIQIIDKLTKTETFVIGKLPQIRCQDNISRITSHNETEKMRNEHQHFNLMTSSRCNELEFADVREKPSDVREEVIVGRTDEKNKIVAALCKSMNQKFTILPIYGIGGIGKTTFAKLIYNDFTNFGSYQKVWVNVSQRFDLNKICDFIISQLSGKENQTNNGQCLMKLFSGKKTLIVLDDLWEDDTFQLEDLKDKLVPGDSINTIVLVTTRSEHVARKTCANIEPFKIKCLTNDMCWEIIKQKSGFEARDDKENFIVIGREIALKCGGLALAAQSLGFMLKSMTFDKWKEVKDSDIWNESISQDASLPNRVLASLKLSYTYSMDECLMSCFTYCAIFPKGYNIVKDDLIYQWISLDFIKPTKMLSTIQLCEKYIAQLLGLSFLQHSMSQTVGAGASFTMHDLVHDLAISLLGNRILDQSEQRNTRGSSCQYALLNVCSMPLESFTTSPATLIALRFMDCRRMLFNSQKLCGAVFAPAVSLRVLDLSECSIQKLPDSIGQLKLLRYLKAPGIKDEMFPECIMKLSNLIYLNLHASRIVALPDSIGELENLMYLDLSDCELLIPKTLGNLRKLHTLNLSSCSKLERLPDCISGMETLKYLHVSGCHNLDKSTLPQHRKSSNMLPNFVVHAGDGESSSNLWQLEYENIPFLEINKLEKVKSAEEAQRIKLVEKQSMRKLHLVWTRDAKSFVDDTELLKQLMPPDTVENFLLQGYKGVSFPSWIMDITTYLPRLNKVVLQDLPSCNKLPPLGQLPNLEWLDIGGMKGIRKIDGDLYGGTGAFSQLRSFCLQDMECLEEWNTAYPRCEDGLNQLVFPELEYLHIWDCPELRLISGSPLCNKKMVLSIIRSDKIIIQSPLEDRGDVDGASYFGATTTLRVGRCKAPLHQWSLLRHLPYLKILSIQYCSDLTCSSSDILQGLSSLKTLYVGSCQSIVALPEWLGDLTSLVKLEVHDCEGIKTLPESIRQLKCLQRLNISGCSKLVRWCSSRKNKMKLFHIKEIILDGVREPSFLPNFVVYGGDGQSSSNLLQLEYENPPFLEITNLEKVISAEEAQRIKLVEKQSMQRLDLVWTRDAKRFVDDTELLKQLMPPDTVEEFLLQGYNGVSFPFWMVDITTYLHRLNKVVLKDLPSCNKLPPLGQLPNLERLEIRGLDGIIKIDGDLSGGTTAFPRLVSFCLQDMECLEEWNTAYPRCEEGLNQLMFPKLELLYIRNCPKLRLILGSPLWNNVIYLSIHRSDKIIIQSPSEDRGHVGGATTNVSVDCCEAPLHQWSLLRHLPHIKCLNIKYCSDLTCSSADILQGLSSLETLYVGSCESIVALPERLGDLTSLLELEVHDCEGIKTLPESIQQLKCLQCLKISGCSKLVQWCTSRKNKMKLVHIKDIILDGVRLSDMDSDDEEPE